MSGQLEVWLHHDTNAASIVQALTLAGRTMCVCVCAGVLCACEPSYLLWL